MDSYNKNFFTVYFNIQSLCENLKRFYSVCSSWLQLRLPWVPVLMSRVKLALETGHVASSELVSNKRHLVGVGFLVVGLGSSFLYRFFDSEIITDETWFFLSWYELLFALREEMFIGFWAIGTFLLLPSKYTLSFVPCAFALAWSVSHILNALTGFTYQVYGLTPYLVDPADFIAAQKAFDEVPGFLVLVPALSLALGFIISVDYLVYRLEHLRKGNVARLVGMVKAPGMTMEEKWPHLEKSADEYLNFNSRV